MPLLSPSAPTHTVSYSSPSLPFSPTLHSLPLTHPHYYSLHLLQPLTPTTNPSLTPTLFYSILFRLKAYLPSAPKLQFYPTQTVAQVIFSEQYYHYNILI